jgi:hypothetical protein
LNPRVTASSNIMTTKSEFLVWRELSAFDGDEQMFMRVWDHRIPPV